MAWQTYTSPASASYRDILTKLVGFATSKHVSAAVINAAGTGYTVGDTLTITHAGAVLPCLIEVLTVGGGGDILTFAIRSGGAFSNRVASLAVNAGGSGYTTGNVIRLTTGTYTEWAKATVTAAAGAVTALAVFETGGAYSVAPSASGATNSDIGLGSGTGCTCTATMTGLIGTTGIAATGGTGASATFDLTLTDTGWSAVANRNDYSFNSITDEKEVVLQGTVPGGIAPLVGIRSATGTVGDTRYSWYVVGMDSFNPLLALTSQANVGPNADPASFAGCGFCMFDDAQSVWFKVDGRRIIVHIKAVGGATTSYVGLYAGLLNPFGTQTESPYPMYLSATNSDPRRKPTDGGFFVTSISEVIADSSSLSPAFFRHPGTGAWTRVQNNNNGTATRTHTVYPLGAPTFAGSSGEDDIVAFGQFGLSFASNLGFAPPGIGAASQHLMPALGVTDQIRLWPLTVASAPAAGTNTSETQIRGEIDDCYWIGATKSDGTIVVAEDTITISGTRYRIFPNVHRRERYSFYAVSET